MNAVVSYSNSNSNSNSNSTIYIRDKINRIEQNAQHNKT
jgi:hypothetical protein